MEGDRQDAAQITAALTNQLASIIAPTASIVSDDESETKPKVLELESVPVDQPSSKGKKKAGNKKPVRTGTPDTSEALDFKHNSETWGNPDQTWSSSKKAIWMLHVAGQQTESKELSAGALAATFNRQFKQAGEIRPSNISRDFGNLKTKKKPAWVGENTQESPSKWYLTTEGINQATQFVVDGKGAA